MLLLLLFLPLLVCFVLVFAFSCVCVLSLFFCSFLVRFMSRFASIHRSFPTPLADSFPISSFPHFLISSFPQSDNPTYPTRLKKTMELDTGHVKSTQAIELAAAHCLELGANGFVRFLEVENVLGSRMASCWLYARSRWHHLLARELLICFIRKNNPPPK